MSYLIFLINQILTLWDASKILNIFKAYWNYRKTYLMETKITSGNYSTNEKSLAEKASYFSNQAKDICQIHS